MVDLDIDAITINKARQVSPLVVMGQLDSLCSNPLEQVIDDGVHYGHGLRGHSKVRMILLQYL